MTIRESLVGHAMSLNLSEADAETTVSKLIDLHEKASPGGCRWDEDSSKYPKIVLFQLLMQLEMDLEREIND